MQGTERVLLPEDAVDFNYVLLMNGAKGEALYRCWAEDNPEEKREMVEKAESQGKDWKDNFKTRVFDLGDFRQGASSDPFCESSGDKGKGKDAEVRQVKRPLMDPVQPGEESPFGVRQGKFEAHFREVKEAVDRFLLVELGFRAGGMEFVKREGITAIG